MDKMTLMEARMHAAEERIRQLEQHIHYPNQVIAERMLNLKDAAARLAAQNQYQTEAKQQPLYAPLRDQPNMKTDVGALLAYKQFVEECATGKYAVSYRAEQEAKRLLGIE